MARFGVTVTRKEIETTPEEQRAIYLSIVEILREHHAYLLTPVQIPLKMELPNPSEKGEDHD